MPPASPAGSVTVLVYSSDAPVRDAVRLALGRRPAPDLPKIDYLEVSDGEAVIAAADEGGIALHILDAEAWPIGGMGLARQMNEEVRDSAPVVLLVARPDDTWLAKWSKAHAVVPHPIDPVALTAAAVQVLRARIPALPAGR